MVLDKRSSVDDEDPLVRQVDTDGINRYVIDFGAAADGVSADVVDETVIVVMSDDEQYEFNVPSTEARTFMKNGVLTIEIDE